MYYKHEKRAFSCTLWIAAFAAPYCSACSQIIWFLFCFEKAQNFANAKSWKPSTNEDSAAAASKNGLNVLVNFEWESFRAAWEHQRRSKCYSSLENGCSIGGWNGSLPTHVFTSSANRHNQGEDHINHVKTHFLVRASGKWNGLLVIKKCCAWWPCLQVILQYIHLSGTMPSSDCINNIYNSTYTFFA